MSLVKVNNLTMAFGEHTVLQNVSLSVDQGEIVTIVGPNGSGKSTLLRVILGALAPHKGVVEHAAKLRIGYVPQKLSIDPTLPITTNRFLRLEHGVRRADCAAALARVDAAELGATALRDLSGGQMQRVLLARALLAKPQILLLDEPTQGLDQPGSANFYRLIEDLRRELNCAVLMVSHELHVVMSASDRVICLNGHVCCHGTPEVVRNAPEYRALFGSATQGALALYRHEHDHDHDHNHSHDHTHDDSKAAH
ncbi:MAG: zinc ABC transporter ATP-binding protein ZnuC [Paracoccaceae bacterium]|nr:zinc ABC transporter ATP-binding protein ZnuC [Paracoccaceae bacterium]